MDTLTLTLLIAILAIWLSVTCGLIALYLLLSGQASGFSMSLRSAASEGDEVTSEPANDAPVLIDDNGAAWGVKVLFDEPSTATNQRLITVMGALEADYDSAAKAYKVSGDSSRTPIVIENAMPPTPLPAPDDTDSPYMVKGVSVQIRATNEAMKPGKLQLARLVKIAKAITRVGGTVVDAQKAPISKAGFKAVIAGKARM